MIYNSQNGVRYSKVRLRFTRNIDTEIEEGEFEWLGL